MGSYYSKLSSDVCKASNPVPRDSPDPVLQHGSSTGDNGPSQGEWIMVSTRNKSASFQNKKVSAAYESASNASGHKGHIANQTKENLKEALKTINNIFTLLSEDEMMLPEPQKEDFDSFCDSCKNANPHSGFYACKINVKTSKTKQDDVLTKKTKKTKKNQKNINIKNIKSTKRNHKGNNYSDKPYSQPLPKHFRKKRPSSHPNHGTKPETKSSPQSKAALKAKIAICKQRKALWMKQNKGHRFSMWNQSKIDKKGLNLTDLDDIHCLYQHLNHLNYLLDQVHNKSWIYDKNQHFPKSGLKKVKNGRKIDKNASKFTKTKENTILRTSTGSTTTTRTNTMNYNSNIGVPLRSARRSTFWARNNMRASRSFCHLTRDVTSERSRDIIKYRTFLTLFCGLRDSPLFHFISSKLKTTILQGATSIMTLEVRLVQVVQDESYERTELRKKPRFPILGPMSAPSDSSNARRLVQHHAHGPVVASATQQQQKSVLAFVLIPTDRSRRRRSFRGEIPSVLLATTSHKRLSLATRSPVFNANDR